MFKATIMREYRGENLAYVTAKLDGLWLAVRDRVAWTRGQKTVFHEPLPVPSMFGLYSRVPSGVTVHGELWAPGRRASAVKSLLASKSYRELAFTVWGIEELGPVTLETLRIAVHMWGLELTPFTRRHAWPIETEYHVMRRDHGDDVEGLVLCDGNMLNQRKWKPVRTVDCVVTGFTDGDGKYLGLVGSLLVSLGDRELARVSGMDDKTRILISDDEDAYLGRVVEVAYQYVGDGGRLRHPRFVRFRDDKEARECTLDQLS